MLSVLKEIIDGKWTEKKSLGKTEKSFGEQ